MLRPILTYRKPRPPQIVLQKTKPEFANEPEQLTGEIEGREASDLEERLWKATFETGTVNNRFYKLSLGAPRGAPGWLELDMLLDTIYGWKMVEVDDISFIHKGEVERQEALQKDLRRLDAVLEMGINPIPQGDNPVWHVTNEDLSNQEDADRWAKENL